jgi:uncharacterized protein (TIGR03382 family)
MLAAVALATVVVPYALADGDPASDYLISQSTFLPLDRTVDKQLSAKLQAMLDASKLRGFPIRVAVIATPYDLGAVPILYKKPVEYARFLGQELFYWYKHELLVVMPNGFGVYDHGTASAADRRLVAALPAPGTTQGNTLVEDAIRGVEMLAARRSIDLSHVQSAGSHSSSSSDRISIGAAAAAALLLAAGVAFFRRRRAARR